MTFTIDELSSLEEEMDIEESLTSFNKQAAKIKGRKFMNKWMQKLIKFRQN